MWRLRWGCRGRQAPGSHRWPLGPERTSEIELRPRFRAPSAAMLGSSQPQLPRSHSAPCRVPAPPLLVQKRSGNSQGALLPRRRRRRFGTRQTAPPPAARASEADAEPLRRRPPEGAREARRVPPQPGPHCARGRAGGRPSSRLPPSVAPPLSCPARPAPLHQSRRLAHVERSARSGLRGVRGCPRPPDPPPRVGPGARSPRKPPAPQTCWHQALAALRLANPPRRSDHSGRPSSRVPWRRRWASGRRRAPAAHLTIESRAGGAWLPWPRLLPAWVSRSCCCPSRPSPPPQPPPPPLLARQGTRRRRGGPGGCGGRRSPRTRSGRRALMARRRGRGEAAGARGGRSSGDAEMRLRGTETRRRPPPRGRGGAGAGQENRAWPITGQWLFLLSPSRGP